MTWRTTFAFIALALLGGCVPTLEGEVDAARGGLTARVSNGLMGGPTEISYQLVILVGPPGAVECGLPGPHQLGAPWRGEVAADRTVTITLPAEDRHGTPDTIIYQCRVVTAEHPEGYLVRRIIRDIEFPLDPSIRDARYAAQRERRREWCAESEVQVIAAGLNCDIEHMLYTPDWSIQPYIVHVGDIDEQAPARWAHLRERVAENCRTERMFMCQYLTNGAWEVLQAADLERTNDHQPPPGF